ncbi:hypothetical protein [Calothrix sp. UHCC 0171]|uniref:hypothetical protein n=1 Tax=Calothrix sp. UHCC 0171 TaxID=3110245 RepID=UPI002B1E934D|nr:hypothetical protein [Calothrix sp. UHCC 0171]MEA5574068.1 hypothetical protein [Calothrix sp. UHCC 0171]
MIKEWRNQLFHIINPEINISTSLDVNLHPLGFPLSLAEGTRILGICYRTWKRWETLAIAIPEYKLQQIQMLNRASSFNATPPIVPYQVWVVGKIGEIYQELPHGMGKKWMAQEYLNAKKSEFTREEYRREQERLVSNVLNEE